MIYNTPPFPLNLRKALICLLIMASPLASGETELKNTTTAKEVTTTKKNTTPVTKANTQEKNDTKVLPELTVTKK